MADIGALGVREAHRLHEVLEAWLCAKVPRTDSGFAPFASALADSCRVISPLGTVTERAALLTEFEGIYGVLATRSADFTIKVENAEVLRAWDDHALIGYEEWHDLAEDRSARRSTALFISAPDAPLGVAWAHIHETWLPGFAPTAGERFPITNE